MKINDIIIKTKVGNRQSPIFNFQHLQIFKLLLLLIVAVSFQSCSQGNEQVKKKKTKKAPLAEVQPAQKTKMVSYTDITGTIEPNVFTHISSPAAGTIDELKARENQRVGNDQIIAVINPTDRESLISENRLKVQQIEEKLKAAEKDSETYKSLQEQLKKAKSNLEYAKNMYQTISVISPMSGLVTQRYLDEGSQVSAGEKILTVSNMNSLVIKANVNERYFEAIEKGKTLRVILNAYPNDTLTGRISLVYPQIDSETRSVNFDIKILNFNKKLLPGMMASVRIPVSVKENALAVPEHAILTSPDGKNFLFVADSSGVAHKLQVQKGITSGKLVEIKQGLKPGDKVVVAGQEMLKDGINIKIMK